MPRPTPLAMKKLVYKPMRTFVSIGGVSLAIILMFMQLGFLGAVGNTATLIYRQMPMDVAIQSQDYLHLFEAGIIDERIVKPLMQLDEVAEVRVLDTSLASWQITNQDDTNGNDRYRSQESRAMAVIGVDPRLPAVLTEEIVDIVPRLTSAEKVVVDRESRSEFGAKLGRFGAGDIGRVAEINQRSYRIMGTFQLGTGLAAAGAVIVNREGFQRLSRGTRAGKCSLLTIRLAKGVSSQVGILVIEKRLAELGKHDLRVLSASDVLNREKQRWYWETPVGLIFMMGVAVAVVVGGMICYMVLAGDVLAHLPEYATLKAMGYTNRFLTKVLMEQALFIAILAFIPAFVMTILLYNLTSQFAEIPVAMTWPRAMIVGALSVVMCMAAGVVALRKLAKAEPANLF